MSHLRWSLLILGVAFIVALSWWEWRRPRQGRARGAELRPAPRASASDLPPARVRREGVADAPASSAAGEPPLELPEMHARGSLAADELPVPGIARSPADVPVLSAAEQEPVRTDPVVGELPVDPPPDPVINLEAEVATDLAADPGTDPAVGEIPLPAANDPPLGELSAAELEDAPAVPGPSEPPRELPRDRLPELPAAPAPLVDWPPDAERRVVALRLVATQPARFAGRSLRQALAAEGFVLGKFAIFHKPDEEQRAVLSAASLTRPGTFDPLTMDSQHYGGLSLFAVVPGPLPLPDTFEELVATARSLNERLQGMLQDEAGSPLTPARIASLREHLGRETPA
jgi:cell division protein ZipA